MFNFGDHQALHLLPRKRINGFLRRHLEISSPQNFSKSIQVIITLLQLPWQFESESASKSNVQVHCIVVCIYLDINYHRTLT